MEIGSCAEWAGAAGTVLAVIVALVVAISDARQRRSERKDERAAQARLVVVETHEDLVGGVLAITVTNHSVSPVFAVVVEALHVTPDALRAKFVGQREWPRIDAGESRQTQCQLFALESLTLSTIQEPNIASADISFVDSAGLRWRRWGNTPPRGGNPIKHISPPPPTEEIDRPST